MTKKIIIAVSGIVLVVLAALKLAHNKSQINKETTYKDIVENVPVRVITAQQITIADKMDFVGVFKASKEASVSAEVAGRIVSVYANEGSYLNEGQVVAQLDTTILQLQLQTDEAQYAHSQEDLARYENLIKHDATTDVTLKQARLTNKLNEIAVKNTREQIAKCSIKAPVAGYLTTKAFEKGTVVSPGVIIGQVVNVSTLKFTAAVPEYQVVKLATGQKVHIAADVYPAAEFMGTITQIAEKGDENHIYKVEATVTNNNRQFPLRAASLGDKVIVTGLNNIKNDVTIVVDGAN